jgi:succinoglycan biosynthesis protein ExoO
MMSVSVLIAAFDTRATIERAIKSVQAQTHAPHEIIVVDDGSNDGTASVVREMAESDPRIKLLVNPVNRGPAASRNRAISMATGEWIAIHDADDAWTLDRLEMMLAAARQYDVDLVADNMLLYDAGIDGITRTGFPVARGVRRIGIIDVFEQDVHLGAEFGYALLQPIVRRAFLVAHSISYNQAVRYGEDLLFLAELLLSGIRAVLIPEAMYIYTTRLGEASGKWSPGSRSTPRFDLLSGHIEALNLKYDWAISPETFRAMKRMTSRYRAVHGANLARMERLQKGLIAFTIFVVKRPDVFTQIMRQRQRALLSAISRKTADLKPA